MQTDCDLKKLNSNNLITISQPKFAMFVGTVAKMFDCRKVYTRRPLLIVFPSSSSQTKEKQLPGILNNLRNWKDFSAANIPSENRF